MARPKTNHVNLSDGEVIKIRSMLKSKKTSKTILKRCQILLDLNENFDKVLTHGQCAKSNAVCRATVSNVVRLYSEEGLEGALKLKRSINSSQSNRKVDGRLEAKIIAIATGGAPDGRSRWTLRLLEDELKLQVGEESAVNRETIRRALKKTNFDLTNPNTTVSPKNMTQNL